MIRKFNISITLLLLLALQVRAQYSSDLGRFEVTARKGCAPLAISINNLQAVNCNPCDVDYGDGNTGQNNYTHTYTTAGIYTIRIDYQSMSPRSDFFEIEITENIRPEFEISTCSNNRATISVIDDNYDQYAIDFDNDGVDDRIVNKGSPVPLYSYSGPGNYPINVRGQNVGAVDNCNIQSNTFTAVNSLPTSSFNQIEKEGTNTIKINYTAQQNIQNRLEISTGPNGTFQVLSVLENEISEIIISNNSIKLDENIYCFRIGSYDACTNSSTYSETICTLNEQLSVEDGRMELSWNGIIGANNYTVCINGECTITAVQPSLTDIDIICGNEYCYTVTANFPNGAKSISSESCGIAFSTAPPTPISQIISKNYGSQIDLTWVKPDNFEPVQYQITGIQSGERELAFLNPQENFTYFPKEQKSTVCFNINYTDNCDNNTNYTKNICSIFLSGSVNSDNSVTLSWNEYNGYDDGIKEYRIEKLDKNGGLQDTFFTSEISFTDNVDIEVFQVQKYRIYAIPTDELLEESFSNEVRIIKKSIANSPDAFTPDGDGLNDEFIFYTSFIKTFNIKIFNRWGELIFTTNRVDQGWNGEYNGRLQPSGSYTFTAEITDLADRSYNLSGIFALIRK